MPVKRHQHSKVPLVAVECQYICNLGLENEHKCLEQLSGREWRYCEDHRESGPEQYKALTNGYYVQLYRDDLREYFKDEFLIQQRIYQYCYRHDLIASELETFFARAEDQQEYFSHLRY